MLLIQAGEYSFFIHSFALEKYKIPSRKLKTKQKKTLAPSLYLFIPLTFQFNHLTLMIEARERERDLEIN